MNQLIIFTMIVGIFLGVGVVVWAVSRLMDIWYDETDGGWDE